MDVLPQGPDLEVVPIVCQDELALWWYPVLAAVAYAVEEAALELPVLEGVEADVSRQSSAEQVVFVELEGEDVVTLASERFTQLPFLSDQTNHADLGVGATEVDGFILWGHF